MLLADGKMKTKILRQGQKKVSNREMRIDELSASFVFILSPLFGSALMSKM